MIQHQSTGYKQEKFLLPIILEYKLLLFPCHQHVAPQPSEPVSRLQKLLNFERLNFSLQVEIIRLQKGSNYAPLYTMMRVNFIYIALSLSKREDTAKPQRRYLSKLHVTIYGNQFQVTFVTIWIQNAAFLKLVNENILGFTRTRISSHLTRCAGTQKENEDQGT